MPTIRTTMQPDRELDVSDAEYLDLQRQGLLVEEDATETVPPATAAPAMPSDPEPAQAQAAPSTTKKSSGAAGSKES